MKKYLLVFIFLFYLYFSFSQRHVNVLKKDKYGIVFKNYNGNPYLNQRKHLLKYLEEITNVSRQDKLGKFAYIDSNRFDIFNMKTIQDSINSYFRVKNIIIKNDNYQNVNGKLKRRTIYLIDLECVEYDSLNCVQFIRLISVDSQCLKNTNKIKVGEIYKMKLYSYFQKDIVSPYVKDGVLVYQVRAPNSFFYSIIYMNIWVVKIDFNSYNWFESPNLKGLYYIP